MTEKRHIEARWAAVISFLLIMFLATIAFVLNRMYPGVDDYFLLVLIIGICSVMLPWCFVDSSILP